MKAIEVHKFGGPEVLKYESVPIPVPGADEVLIKVYASGVNPIDTKMRQGFKKHSLPFIPGWDVSGVVESIGNHVSRFKQGEEVFGRSDPQHDGTYAEYVVVHASGIGHKPKSVDHLTAGTVPVSGLAAWQGLFDHGELKAGQRILIHGAAGGVGHFAVQFAKWKGAYVIATTSGKHIGFVTKMGADEVINYQAIRFEQQVKDVDMVFDTVGGDVQLLSLETLKQGGILVSTLPIEHEDTCKAKGVRCKNYMAQAIPEQLEQIAQLIDEKKIKPFISTVLPLDQAAEAHRILEEGHGRGKIVLQVQG